MRVALVVDGQDGAGWDDWLALADACERGAAEALLRSDHYQSFTGAPGGSLDAWGTTVALAARTRRIRLGTLVSPVTLRHPSELARLVVTADHVSGGRVELGLGVGWLAAEHAAHGFAFPDLRTRTELLEEQLEIVTRQWAEEEVDFAGRHYRLERCRAEPKPLQRPRPTVIVGGLARRRSVASAVRFADEYNTVYVTPEQFAEQRARVDAACRAAGRAPLVVSAVLAVVTGRTRAEVAAREERALRGREPPPALVSGTVDEVVARLREYARAGCERVHLHQIAHEDIALAALLAGEVAPALAIA